MRLQSVGLREWHVFWREEILPIRSQEEALAALGAAGPDRNGILSELLREAGGAGPIESPGDLTKLLASGELVLIRRAADRKASAGIGPMLWKYPPHGALSEFGAQGFLRRFLNDPLAFESMRRMTQYRLHTSFHGSLTPDALLAAVARWLSSGELVVAFRMFSTGGGETADVVEPKPAPEAQSAPRETKTPEPEAATFSSDHASDVQAQALTEASQQGVPFCEECMRAAMQQAGN